MLTTTRASCRGERREITIERWHVRRRPSDVSDRRRDLAANRCPVTAPPDDVQRSIGHVAERDHVLTTRGNDLASARDDLTSRINDLTSRIDDLTSRINDLTSTFNDLTSIPHDLMLASETLNHGNPVGAVGHVVCGQAFGEIVFIYKSPRGAKCLLFCCERSPGRRNTPRPPVGENAHPLRPLQSRMTRTAFDRGRSGSRQPSPLVLSPSTLACDDRRYPYDSGRRSHHIVSSSWISRSRIARDIPPAWKASRIR